MDYQITREHMREYLRNPINYECRVTISHSRVVQKSYEKEKRFFCLPPTVTLEGMGWKSLCNFVIDTGSRPWYEATTTERLDNIVGAISSGDAQSEMLEFSNQKNYSQAKKMTMSKEDPRFGKSDKNCKSTFFDLTVTLAKKSGQLIGVFKSDRIKVISKKPKKNQSIKNTDCKTIFITSGSTVSLSCKTKSANALYMYTDSSGFVGSTERWSSMEICLMDEKNEHEVGGFVHFGQVVRLRDRKTGISHPLVRVCRIEGTGKMKLAKSGKDEPVCQLYKCAFQLLDQEDHFLAIRQDGVILHYDANKDGQFSDAAIWTISSCCDTEFRFYYAFPRMDQNQNAYMDQNQSSYCHTLPILPTVTKVFIFNDTVYVEGTNFPIQMQIWLGDLEMPTTLVSNFLLCCPLPTLGDLSTCFMAVEKDVAHIPVSLVHQNIIFATRDVLQLSRDIYDNLATPVLIQQPHQVQINEFR